MRYIKTHHVNECNRHVQVLDLDFGHPYPPGHAYRLITPEGITPEGQVELYFQSGPIQEVGVNGITNEALLAVLIDRMEHFQRGEYACRENALALTKLQEAMHWLDQRTRDREERGVEGTHTP